MSFWRPAPAHETLRDQIEKLQLIIQELEIENAKYKQENQTMREFLVKHVILGKTPNLAGTIAQVNK